MAAENNNMNNNDEVSLVKCGTTKGDIVFEFHKAWSPNGYAKAIKLFKAGYYDHSHFFRTVKHFLVQFGISYNAALEPMARKLIPDDPQLNPRIPFTIGTISYAGSGPNSRSSHLFISLMADGGGFGRELWETPVGRISSGMDVVHQFYSDYGDMPPWGKGPSQQKIHDGGEAYMVENFPLMDRFLTCTVELQQPSSSQQKAKQIGADEAAAVLEVAAPKPVDALAAVDKVAPMQPTATLRKHNTSNPPTVHAAAAAPGHGAPPLSLSGGGEYVTGQLHHQHSLHFNNGNSSEEAGLTRLSWELVGSVLILFIGVLILWLRFVLTPPKKSRKTS